MQVGDTLLSGQIKKIIITIEYKDITDKTLLPSEDKVVDIDFRVKYVQSMLLHTTNKIEKTYRVGDKFCLNGNEECFYTITDNDDIVTALSECFVNQSTSRQQSDSRIVCLAFYETNYWVNSNNYSNGFVYDSNSNLFDPVENYEDYLKNTLGKTSVTASLLSYHQAVDLGCPSGGGSCKDKENPAPSWFFKEAWLGTRANYNSIYVIQTNGNLSYVGYRTGVGGIYGYKIRPVITISKAQID